MTDTCLAGRRPPVVRWEVPVVPGDDRFLGDGERRRSKAFGTSVARDRFVARRWYVRRVVADVAGCDPIEVVVEQRCPHCGGPHGRPRVQVPGGRAPFVSWAWHEGLTVVAVGRTPVGVDVCPGSAPRSWARLEAVLKATGHGLDVDPSLVELSDHGVRRWQGPGRRPRLRIVDLPVGGDLVAAVAHAPWGPFRRGAGAGRRRATA